MEHVSREAQDRRRGKESILTSTRNSTYHGSPCLARKREFWPPFSETSESFNRDDLSGGISFPLKGVGDNVNDHRNLPDRGEIGPDFFPFYTSAGHKLGEKSNERRNNEHVLTLASTNCFHYAMLGNGREEFKPPTMTPERSNAGESLGDIDSPLGSTKPKRKSKPERRNHERIISSQMLNRIAYAYAKARHAEFRRLRQHGHASINTSSEDPPSREPVPEQRVADEMVRLKRDKSRLYHPLHHGDVIRVLQLHPGPPSEQLRCDFHYVSLQYPHKAFQALSYVWGEKNTTSVVTVECNGHVKRITPNLDNALRHIRHITQPTYLFVDALSINQNDKRERGHQVSLMGAIYRKARRVLIWVGDARDASDTKDIRPADFTSARAQRSFGAVCTIVNRWANTVNPTQTANYSVRNLFSLDERQTHTTFEEFPSVATHGATRPTPGAMKEVLEADYMTWTQRRKRRAASPPEENVPRDEGVESSPSAAAYSQFWLSLADLFQRPFFWRMWVVQEAVLARTAVVMWANAEIDFRWVGLASAILRTNHRDICESLNMGGVYNSYLMYRMSSTSDLPSLELSFLDLLRLTRQLEVTDARDRVYGLLGMKTKDNDPSNNSLLITPDYTITESELWKTLAWKTIKMTGNLSILSSVQYTKDAYETDPTAAIPTWVPNWGTVYRTTLAPWDPADAFSAARGFPLQLENPSDSVPATLKVDSIEIGTVGYTGSYMWQDIDTSLLLSDHLAEFFTSTNGIRLLSQTLTAGRDSYGSLTRSTDSESTLSDFAAYLLRRYDNDIDSFTRVFDLHPKLLGNLRVSASDGKADRFWESAWAMCKRRRLFLTVNGYLGLGPDPVQDGDILAILSGGDVPFILRPIARSKLSSGDPSNCVEPPPFRQEYLLVGECYCFDLMDGQAVRAADEEGDLVGPVPTNLILQQIVSDGNRAGREEKLRGESKCERLNQDDPFTSEALENLTSVHAIKRSIEIF